MGMSWHCEHEKRMDKIGTGIIQCALDGQICLNQQYCPSKRRYEITASYAKCGKRNGEEKENGDSASKNEDALG